MDWKAGLTVSELSLTYKVSERTVMRRLTDSGVNYRVNRRKQRRKTTVIWTPVELKPCGTNAAYARHKRNGEYPCDACLAAHAADVAKYQPPKSNLKRHGTVARYKWHLSHKEKPCDKCKAAEAKRQRRYRARKKKNNAKTRRIKSDQG